ncbi:MAG TPA: FAD-dependent monooxygenase [Herpetosiphonaceae bacterium]|nr:FAD-dependent monooxygenase [Herpetosiphonaceae bacterium]
MNEVIIIGAGIGGLTAAIALRQRGIAATIYEAAPASRALGAGIWVPPNAMEILSRLGLAEAVVAAGAALESADIRDDRGVTIQRAPMPRAADGKVRAVAIHRARLHEILLAAAGESNIRFGKACAGVEQDGERATVSFADGSQASAACVVGADGLRSAVRQRLFPDVPLRYSGQSSYRAVVSSPLATAAAGAELWGAGRRFGFSALADGQVYWYATFNAPAGQRDTPGTIEARLRSLFAGFPAPIPALIGATPPESIVHTDIFDCPPLAAWHRGRVGLIGDAAHAATPNLGQGGAQAIEDAYVLAECLAGHDHPDAAFAAFERRRRDKALLIVRRSWHIGKVAHWRNPLARSLRNGLIRRTPARITERQVKQLYELGY